VYFQAEEDRNTAWMPKIAVVLGLTLAALVVLLPPLDVANRSSGGELDVSLLYQVMFVAIAVIVVVVIPFLIFYYEAEDPESARGQLCWAIVYETVTLASAATVLVVMWIFLGRAQIPVTQYVYAGPLLDATAETPAAGCGVSSGCVPGESSFYEIGVTPVVYIMALSSFVGWFFLALFGGIGMAALPLDLMLAYKSRPQSITPQVSRSLWERTFWGGTCCLNDVGSDHGLLADAAPPHIVQDYAKQRIMLHERAQRLRAIGQGLGLNAAHDRNRKTRVAYNKFKQAVYFLEQDWAKVTIAYKQRGGNPLRCVASLV
jgi:LMBR1 domain-containing protein 1